MRTSISTNMRRSSLIIATTLALGLSALPSSAPPALAQECHYAYGGCLPYTDDLDCADIDYAVVEVWDVNDDPYELDVLYGPGNGWTCDGVG